MTRLRVLSLLGLALLLGGVTRLDSLQAGLNGRYFLGIDSQAAPARAAVDAPPSTERLAEAWGPAIPETFTATWNGAVFVWRDGIYRFATTSDDASHVFVDGQLVVDNGGAHAVAQRTGAARLTAGLHAIFVDYSQQGGAFHFELQWGRDDAPLRRVPAWVLVTRRVGAARYLASAGLWCLAAVAAWLSAAVLLVGLAHWTARWLLRLRHRLSEEGLWQALRWVLPVSFIFNVAGIWWGLPGNWVPAEIVPKDVMEGLAQKFAHGWHGTYPPFHFYLLSLAMSPLMLMQRLGLIDLSTDTGYTLLSLVCRLVSIVFAAGIVIALARVGARAFGPRAGWIGAAGFALSAPFVFYAKTANTDTPYLFWFAVAMVFYVRVLDHLRLRDFLAFGIAATLSVCSKDQAYGLFLLMPLPIVQQLWRAYRREGQSRPIVRALADRRLWTAGAVAAIAFALSHNLLFNLDGFEAHVRYIAGPGSADYQVFDADASGHLQLLRLTLWLIQQSFAWPMTVAAGAGLLFALHRPDTRWLSVWLLTPVVSYYVGFIDVILYNYDRFVLPIGFVLAAFAGLAVDRLLAAGAGARRWRVAIVGGGFAYTALYAATVDILMIRDSRYFVQEWMAAHVRPDALVAATFPADYLPRLDTFRHADLGSSEAVAEATPAYYVLNEDYARAVPRESPTGRLIAGLQQGTIGYRRVFTARSPSPWPWLVGAHHDLVGPRYETRVSTILRNINPTVAVFERDRP